MNTIRCENQTVVEGTKCDQNRGDNQGWTEINKSNKKTKALWVWIRLKDSPSDVYGELWTTSDGCSDELANRVSPAASKIIYAHYVISIFIFTE